MTRFKFNQFMTKQNRSSDRRCSVRKNFSRNFAKFIGKYLCHSLFNKVAGLRSATLLKKWTWRRCFLLNFAKFLSTSFSQHLWSTASNTSYFLKKLINWEMLILSKLSFLTWMQLFAGVLPNNSPESFLNSKKTTFTGVPFNIAADVEHAILSKKHINPFHATDISFNTPWFSDVFREYQKRIVAWNWLIQLFSLKFSEWLPQILHMSMSTNWLKTSSGFYW